MREPNQPENRAMTQPAEPCPREGDVLHALESPRKMEMSLVRHVEGCPACRETVWLHGLLAQDAGALEAKAARRQAAGRWRTPAALWTLAHRHGAVRPEAVGGSVRRALLPIRVVEGLGGLLAVLAVLWGLIRGLSAAASGAVPLLSEWGRRASETLARGFAELGEALATSATASMAGSTAGAGSPEAVMALVVLLGVAALAVGLWHGWSEA